MAGQLADRQVVHRLIIVVAELAAQTVRLSLAKLADTGHPGFQLFCPIEDHHELHRPHASIR